MRPLPFAPRPFADEALGSWIGRVAGRYRMNVTQLDTDYELRLGLTTGLFWLVPAVLSPVTLERLCALTRLPTASIAELTSANWLGKMRGAPYCSRCVFLNPDEVESPYWKREWLVPDALVCDVHDLPLALLKAREVRASRNTPDLITRVGRQERETRRLH